ncbi:asparagine synthetase B [Vibrio zhanjiangensis]|uniref:asparagine synthase (glutamine-hydrolyzing) n=1 Tax=Vibrio zhanjiangensis TaxID=1046128 RepID=A0ABQ6EWE0_9VIBR|nr:asparagine synthase (glutamine-hydrolyzing) [Vibrio zhanjiangensis]GLT17500.1 asparagine synthetase B [Vibrio zhanjiangensis]
MCSILTFLTNKEFSSEFVSSLPERLKRSEKRGPDSSGSLLINNSVYLGSNRLRIIGDDNGVMPISSFCENYHIVFNGEVYNHKELRKELESDGYNFKTNTDTEVILNLYIKFKEDFIKKLNGIFSIVIFDKKRDIFICARDRFGTKPLYYLSGEDYVGFSSDYQTLVELLTPSQRQISKSALSALLMTRMVPGEKTILSGINKVEHATIQIWDRKTLSCNTYRYWSPTCKIREFKQSEFNTYFRNAVNRVFEADVEPSILLSGGLDSAALVTELGYSGRIGIKTYSCTFEGAQKCEESDISYNITNGNIDESAFAIEVANTHSFHHENFKVNADIDEDTFDQMQAALGEPIPSTNALGLYLLGKSLPASERLAVSGTGSDEILGGYETLYFKEHAENHINTSNASLLKSFSNFDSVCIEPLSLLNSDYVDTQYLDQYLKQCMSSFDEDKNSHELLNQLAIFELNFGLPGWELDQADRLFMDFSIELRPGFLENEFVDYCLSIPSKDKSQKLPLRNAMRAHLPSHIVDREKLPSLSTPKEFIYGAFFQKELERIREEPLDFWNKEALTKLIDTQDKESIFDLLYRVFYIQKWVERYLGDKSKMTYRVIN